MADIGLILNNNTDTSECGHDALTSSYGWLIQGILAVLVFGLLVVKRFCEPIEHRRSWLVWFFDTSKQGFGSLIVHFANIFLAEWFTGDPCTWYIVSFLLDSTVGLIIMWLGIKTSIYLGRTRGYPTLLFGEYGRPPSIVAWAHQCLVYIFILFVLKLTIVLLMEIPIWDGVRTLILSPFHDPKLKVAFAVVIIPFIVNALIFWVTDNFLMLKYKKIDYNETPVIATSFSNNDKNDAKSKVSFRKLVRIDEEESNGLLMTSSDEALLGVDEDLQTPPSPIRPIRA